MQRFDQLRSLLIRVAATGDPWDRLNALAHLRRELESAETELAADALHAGFTWSQIGEALGISKQAAHRRHSHGVARLDQAAQTEHGGRNVIVSAEARQAVRIARREAATMGMTRVGTEHLLLGLLQCGDRPTERLLERLGVALDRARECVQPTLELKGAAVRLDEPPTQPAPADEPSPQPAPADEPSPQPAPADEPSTQPAPADEPSTQPAPADEPSTQPAPADESPAEPAPADEPPETELVTPGPSPRRSAAVSPLARRVLERALAEMQRHSADTLGALDLLRAVLRDDKGGAARTLAMLGVEPESVREEIERIDAVIVPPP